MRKSLFISARRRNNRSISIITIVAMLYVYVAMPITMLFPNNAQAEELQYAVFSSGNIRMDGSATIQGNAVTNTGDVDFSGNSGSKITGKLYTGPGLNIASSSHIQGGVEKLSTSLGFNMPTLPTIPGNLTKRGDLTISSYPAPQPITEDGWYTKLSVVSNETLKVNVENGDRIIRADELSLNGHIELIGNGKLKLYVDKFAQNNTTFNINKGKDSSKVEIYIYGSDTVKIAGDSKIAANIYMKDADFDLAGSAGISGNIFVGGTDVKMSGGSDAFVGTVFAPNASVDLKGSATIEGVLICKEFRAVGNALVKYNSGYIYFPPEVLPTPTPTVTPTPGPTPTVTPTPTLTPTPVPNITKKILEVQPGTSFKLNSSILSTVQGLGDAQLVQMTMTEFISRIDDINGKYDIVYIGNNSIGGNAYNTQVVAATSLPQGGSSSIEYYSENDVTYRIAEKIKEFINSGQLAMFDESIFSSALNQTKLYNSFIDYYNERADRPNFVTVNFATEEDITQALDKYNTSARKRPVMTVKSKPTTYGYDSTGNTYTYQANNVLGFNFNINSINNVDDVEACKETVTVKLYVDINGDGIFSDDECEDTLTHKTIGEGYTLNYRLPESFTGLQPWKVEVIDGNNVKTYETGYAAFKGAQPLNVRVLQIIPTKNTLSIKDSLKDGTTSLLYREGEYNITAEEMAISDFEKKYTENPDYRLNGNYDMIVLGFADIYGGGDIKNQLAVADLKRFIESGQSVMFTHDTMTYLTTNTSGWAYNLTKEFRDIIGQNRYVSDPFPSPFKPSYGFTRLALDRAANGSNPPISTNAYKLNDGLLTQYPFILGNIPVASTHHQYFQLDMEDENVIPWYTLSGSSFNSIDGRNDYYTYTKGNVTYSGAGHSNLSASDASIEERKLFVNTMIKAARGANHSPSLTVNGLSNGGNVSKDADKIQFSFVATDPDVNDQYLNAGIYIDPNNSGQYTTVQEFDINSHAVVSGQVVDINIDKSIYVQPSVNAFKIKIAVWDNRSAGARQEFLLNHVAETTATVKTTLDSSVSDGGGYLIGDTANITYTITKNNATENTVFSNIKIETVLDPDAFEVVDSGWQQGAGNTWYKTMDSPDTVTLAVKLKKVGNYNLSNTINYTVGNVSKTPITTTCLIPVVSGKIDINVKDTKGRGINDVPITIKRVGGATLTADSDKTNDTAFYTKENLSSGTYEVSIIVPTGYGFDNEGQVKTKTVVLSYTSSTQPANFELSGSLVVPNTVQLKSLKETTPTVIKNGVVYAKVEFTLNRDVDKLEVKFAIKDEEQKIVDGFEVLQPQNIAFEGEDEGKELISDYDDDKDSNDKIIVNNLKAGVTYYTYVALKVGTKVAENKSYMIQITNFTTTLSSESEEYTITIPDFQFTVVPIPGLL